MKRFWILLLLAGGLASAAVAGVEYEARTWQEGEQANDQSAMTVRGLIEGDRARIEFRESANPWMGEGTYLLTTDAGRTIYLVDPEEKSYGEFDLEAMMRMVGAFTSSGLIDLRIENPRVESLPAGPARTIAGLTARHARYRTSYDMEVKVLGFKRRQQVETLQDVWYTDELGDPAMAVWLRKEPPRTGTDLDALIDLEIDKIAGFPLEMVETMTTTGKKGKESTTTSHTRVTELRRGVSFPPGTFEIPEGYTQVQMMPTAEMVAAGGQEPPPEAGEAEGEEEEGGLVGRLKRFGRKKKDR